MRSRTVLQLATAVASLALAARASAQARASIVAARHDTLQLGVDGTVTAAFTIRNLSADSLTAAPTLTLPVGWSSLLPPRPVQLRAHESDLWLIGVSSGMANAGAFTIRAHLRNGDSVATDSVVVLVPEHRAFEVGQGVAPPFIAAGDGYDVHFVVRNRGNVPATIQLRLTSSASSDCRLSASGVTVLPGTSTSVLARITTAGTVPRAVDDVVELVAVDPAQDSSTTTSSSHTLVVPRRTSRVEEAPFVPATVAFRAAGPGAGVSPVVLIGSGPISPGSTTLVDFALRTPAGTASPFGERDEYRFDLTADRWRLGLGDEGRSFSPLTFSGLPGFGAEMQGDVGAFNTGAYVQKVRYSPLGGTEAAFAIGAGSASSLSASAVEVARSGGAEVSALTGHLHLSPAATMDVEVAASDSGGASGAAARGALVGQFAHADYDLGILGGTQTFVGPIRGNSAAHGSVNLRPDGPVYFTVTANEFGSSTRSLFDSSLLTHRITMTGVEANFSEKFALMYETLSKFDEFGGMSSTGEQDGLRARAQVRIGSFDLRANASREMVRVPGAASAPEQTFGFEVQDNFAERGSLAVFAQQQQGSSLSSVELGGLYVGTLAQLKAPLGIGLSVNSSLNLPRGIASVGYAQSDVMITHAISNGAVIAFRDRTTKYIGGIAGAGTNALYLELRAPLHVRSGFARAPGRAEGHVVDAASGRGLSNLLVRVGGESVITDANGRVSLSGLSPGTYGVSLESVDRASPGVLVGDVSVDITGARRPSTFNVALARGARITASVRRMAGPTAQLSGKPDSLVDAGPVENALVVLQGARDTIYQTTDADGHIDFGELAPGVWTIHVISADMPENHSIEVDQFQITVAPGEHRAVEFRVVPRHRPVKLMGPDQPPVIRSLPDPITAPPTVVLSDSAPAPRRDTQASPAGSAASHHKAAHSSARQQRATDEIDRVKQAQLDRESMSHAQQVTWEEIVASRYATIAAGKDGRWGNSPF
jgi:hypothetical protein